MLYSSNSLVWSFEGVIILSEEVADGWKVNVDPRSGVGVGSGPGVPLSCSLVQTHLNKLIKVFRITRATGR